MNDDHVTPIRERSSDDQRWRPSEYKSERFSLGRRAFNAREDECCECVDICSDLLQGDDLPICRALPRGGDRA